MKEGMIKTVPDRVWAFDCEWIPDPLAGRLLYDLPDATPPADVMRRMWDEGGADEEDPTPYLKTAVCRVVSIAAVERREKGGQVSLSLVSIPREVDDVEETREATVIGRFLQGIGDRKPQLVGYNSFNADLKILIQRGVILGLRAAGFSARPDKPWQGMDYFARHADAHVDLKDVWSGFGKGTPSLHEMAVQSGIPGKLDIDGDAVASLWLEGNLRKIVQYNECDALTTYLVWLRLAHFAGHFTSEQYEDEQQHVRTLIETERTTPGREHLGTYLEAWDRLRALVEPERAH